MPTHDIQYIRDTYPRDTSMFPDATLGHVLDYFDLALERRFGASGVERISAAGYKVVATQAAHRYLNNPEAAKYITEGNTAVSFPESALKAALPTEEDFALLNPFDEVEGAVPPPGPFRVLSLRRTGRW